MENDNDDAELARLRALSASNLTRELFASTLAAGETSDLERYRAMSNRELVEGLFDDSPLEHGRCKRVLAERMAAAGVDDICDFIGRDVPRNN
jgi:hypothetical protein